MGHTLSLPKPHPAQESDENPTIQHKDLVFMLLAAARLVIAQQWKSSEAPS